jgi:uncharacterized SAM-binding protein YcdF (DUF218 family)
MFMTKKLLTLFVIPPGIFIVCLLATGGWLLYKKIMIPGIIILMIGTLAWFVSTSPVADVLLYGLEHHFKIPENPSGDVIVLLSRGVYYKAPDFSGTGVPWDNTITRLVTAVRLEKKLEIPIIVSGGGNTIIKRFLMDLGVSENHIICDDKGRDTYESAKFVYEICTKMMFNNPILVTAAYHMKRSVLIYNKFKIKVIPFPAGFKSTRSNDYGIYDFIPTPWNFTNTGIAIKEYLGLLVYKYVY